MPAELVLSLFGLALLDSLSPATLLVTLAVLLTAATRGWVLLLIYWGTIASAYFALGVALMLGLGAVSSFVDETVGLWFQVILGVALLIGSFFIRCLLAHRRADRPRNRARLALGPTDPRVSLGRPRSRAFPR